MRILPVSVRESTPLLRHPLPLAEGICGSTVDSGEAIPTSKAQEGYEAVRVALRVLPQAQREALVLYHMEGLPLPHVAEILDRPESVLRQDLERGLDRLRRRLARRDVESARLPGLLKALPVPEVSAELTSAAKAIATTGKLPAVKRRNRRYGSCLRSSARFRRISPAAQAVAMLVALLLALLIALVGR